MGGDREERRAVTWNQIPKIWEGENVACVACGPSLHVDDIEALLHPCKILVVNDAYRRVPWADMLYACDPAWWDRFAQEHMWVDGKVDGGALEFRGLKVTQDSSAALRWGIIRVESRSAEGMSLDSKFIHRGHNSGFQAVNLAVLCGARRIALLGYDMGRTGGRAHWFGDHPPGLQKRTPFDRCIQAFGQSVEDIRRAGVQVVNVSRETSLRCFPCVPVKEAWNAVA